MEELIPLIATAAVAGLVVWALVKLTKGAGKGVATPDPLHLRNGGRAAQRRQEALFVTTFPELQPYFHPEKVLEFVSAWRARASRPETFDWNNPPGLRVQRARFAARREKGQPVDLLDSAAQSILQFLIEETPEGAAIRLGAGKLKVNVRDAAVGYWHPQREFKWSRAKGWRMITSVADRPIESSDRGTSFVESSSSSSSSSSSESAARAAAVAGAGGTFDGGGASDSWDERSGGSGSDSTGSAATAY
jgi:uncharacterized membrane protein YgcG